jgi:hypothetical protein
MTTTYPPLEVQQIAQARESFSGRLLTDNQFDEGIAITGIIEREIQKSGTFKEKLHDFSFAYARTERFDQMKAETIIRDLFKERVGQTMNQMREKLKANEDALTPQQKLEAVRYARAIEPMIRDGDKISFRRAYAHQAGEMASSLNITESGAKRHMSESFQAQHGKDLIEWGKELDNQYYRPQIDAQKRGQDRPRQQTLSLTR